MVIEQLIDISDAVFHFLLFIEYLISVIRVKEQFSENAMPWM